MIRLLAGFFTRRRAASAQQTLVLAPQSHQQCGVWWPVRNAYVAIEGELFMTNTSRRLLEVLHIDLGYTDPGAPRAVRARFNPTDVPARETERLSFSVVASPIFRVTDCWLLADLVLWDDHGRVHRLPASRFRRSDSA